MSTNEKCPICGSLLEQTGRVDYHWACLGCGKRFTTSALVLDRQSLELTRLRRELDDLKAENERMSKEPACCNCQATNLKQLAELKAIVDLMPKTADGAPAYKEMPVWCVMPNNTVYGSRLGWYSHYNCAFAHELRPMNCGYRMPNGCWREVSLLAEECYSTIEAAEAALSKQMQAQQSRLSSGEVGEP